VGRVFFWVAAVFGTLLMLLFVVAAVTGRLHLNFGGSASAPPSGSALASPMAVQGFRCAPAVVEGPGATEEIGRAIGIGACARLGVETGLLWAHEGARGPKTDLDSLTRVAVTLKMGAPAEVVVRVGDLEGTGRGPAPMAAMLAAVAELAPKIQPRALDEAERAAWGAKTDESARRIERAWRRLVLGDIENPEAELRALIASDGESPWPHAMLCLAAPRGSAASIEACKATTTRLAVLPPNRAKAIEGVAALIGDARMDDAIKLFRQSYRAAPDDPDVAGLYGAVVLDTAADEGYGVIDGVAQRFPSYALVPLTTAIAGSQVRDRARNAKYIARLNEILPEQACEDTQFGDFFYDAAIDELRARLAHCVALHGTEDVTFALIAAEIELAALQPDKARALAAPKLSDPRETYREVAIRQSATAHALAGRVEDASIALEAEMRRQRDQQSPRYALQRSLGLLRLRALAGYPISDKLVPFVRGSLDEDRAAPSFVRMRVEAVLAMHAPTSKQEKTRIAEGLLGSDATSDPFYAIPLLREVYGDAKTREILAARPRVSTRARVVNALDYAALLEAVRAPESDIEAAYQMGMVPIAMDLTAFDKVVARLRLATLYDKMKRPDDAKKLRAEVDAVWQNADPGLREAVLRRR
jgi:hypothetical protein